MKQHLGDGNAVPPQHVIVYDEAQRAWDVEQVAAKHALPVPVSEPEAFVESGERIPGWGVLVGLIGSGQEIHVGEEAGLGQWRTALKRTGEPGGWTVHAPQRVLDEFFAPASTSPMTWMSGSSCSSKTTTRRAGASSPRASRRTATTCA